MFYSIIEAKLKCFVTHLCYLAKIGNIYFVLWQNVGHKIAANVHHFYLL